MRNILATTATALTLALMTVPAAVSAQTVVVLTPVQQSDYDGWPVERRTVYDTWNGEVRTYYWTLNPEQRAAWWALTNEERARIYALPAAERVAAWSRLRHTNPVAAAATRAAHTSDRAPGDVADAVHGAQKTYPICQGAFQDSCINPRQAGKSWGNRPLQDWPGAPASELRGKHHDGKGKPHHAKRKPGR